MFLTLFAPAPAPLNDTSAIALIDSMYAAGDPAASLARCEARVVEKDDPRVRWRAARAAIAMGMMRADGPERRLLYDRALAHARAGAKLAPNDVQARYWVAAAAGRRAHRDDPVLSARLALEVYDHASAILATDSTHAGAHHALGMLHAEVLRAPRLIRMIAGRVLRMDVANRANPREAERHLRRAVELEPTVLLYMADLAEFYARTRRHLEARTVAKRIGAVQSRHPMDYHIRQAFSADQERLRLVAPE